MQLRMVARVIAARSTLGQRRPGVHGVAGRLRHARRPDHRAAPAAGQVGRRAEVLPRRHRGTRRVAAGHRLHRVGLRRTLSVNGDGSGPRLGQPPPGAGWRGEGRPLLRQTAGGGRERPRRRGPGPAAAHHLGDEYAATLATWFGVSDTDLPAWCPTSATSPAATSASSDAAAGRSGRLEHRHRRAVFSRLEAHAHRHADAPRPRVRRPPGWSSSWGPRPA